jgi:preprotein translocase subunit SecD
LATTTRRERPARPLIILALLVATLAGALLAGTRWSDATATPQLALDLEGGTEIILQPVAEDETQVTNEAITQAISIIRQRIDASGVAEAEITSQGQNNIVVALPGEPDEATLALVKESAQMVFRPVLVVTAPGPIEDTTADDPDTADDATADDTTADDADTTDDTTADDTDTTELSDTPATEPTDPSDLAWLTEALLAEYEALDCTDPANLRGGASRLGDPATAVVTCDETGTAKYALGPVEVTGDMIDGASSGLRTTSTGAITGEWITTVSFDGAGTTAFRDATTRLSSLESPRDQFAIVLDGLVVSAPGVNEPIPSGQAEISGNFTRETAATLARQLNFGALPLTFEVQSEQQISATLGSEQLQRGLLAGLIGLILVGVYSIAQYRALGLVTIASLVAAAAVAYLTITTLSWLQGYRLSLPGVAGLIVAIGITADSFIVYFERIKDELREGRTLAAAVDTGWSRAKRTILASDAVSFLAAVVLYFLAVGGVRGFAFTLGLTTLVDLLIVFMFTHPVMLLISRHRFFAEGHRFSGLDPSLLGARSRYVGRGRVAQAGEPAAAGAMPVAAVAGAGAERLTIAERKAAQRRAAAPDQAGAEGKDA